MCRYKSVSHMKILNCMLQAGPPSLHYCAVVLRSCIVLPPVGHSSNHQYHCWNLQDNRNVVRIFIALLRSSFDFPSYIYTGCPRRKGPNFGRVFLRSNYNDITQNTYIQSSMVTEIMTREIWNFDSYYPLIDYQIHIETGRNMWFLYC